MKFDKFMEHCFRILCLATACVVVVGAVASCARPLRARAAVDPVDLISEISDFRDTYLNNVDVVSNAVITDLNNGNLDATSSVGQQVLQSLALQTAFGSWLTGYYGQPNLSITWEEYVQLPNSLSVSGSGACGLYRISGSPDLRVCYLNLYNNSFFSGAADIPLVTSNDFEVYFSISNDNNTYTVLSDITGNYFNFSTSANWWTVYINSTNSVGFSDLNQWTSQGRYALSSSIPTLTSIPPTDTQSNNIICGNANSVDLPENSVDKSSPWDYYNNTLLPYMQSNFPDVPSIYFVFPDGYTQTQDPTEPNYINPNVNFNGVGVGGLAPIILGAGAIINVAGNNINVFAPVSGQIRIDGIQLQFPLDNDNEVYIDKQKYTLPTPELSIGDHLLEVIDKYSLVVDGLDWLINGDGTITIDDILYNLPIGEIETIPIDASEFVYAYEIPTLENIEIVDASLVAPDLSDYGSSIQMIFAMSHDVLQDVGALPVFLIILSLSAVGYGLWKIGG